MLPLTVMSFKAVRKKMNAKMWKKIQRLAYLFYALIFIHILVLFVPRSQNGRDGYFLSVLVYSAVFIGYAAMRIRKAFVAKRRQGTKTVPNVVCACAMILPQCLIGFVSRNTNDKETIKATKEAPATFVFDQSGGTKTAGSTLAVTTVSETTAAVTEVAGTTTALTTEALSEQPETSVSETSSETETKLTVTATTETTSVKSETTTVTETTTVAATTVPEPVYRFKNGTFEGTGEGYAGTVHVSITIENDYITAFSAYADDDDPDYFSDAMQHVIPQIQQSMSADVDACSGATYSSKGIIEAARNALEKAMK